MSLAPGEIAILKVLGNPLESLKRDEIRSIELSKLLKSYSELKEKAELSDPVLSNYLKDLQKRRIIKRDIDSRKYFLTEDVGRITLKIAKIVEILKRWMSKLKEFSEEDMEKIDSVLDTFYAIFNSHIL